MLCECGARLQWRCTNQENHIAKYKCPNCGHVVTKVVEPVADGNSKLEKPNYYYRNHYGTYTIHRNDGGHYRYYGTYSTEDIARAMVRKLSEYGWDKNCLQSIRDELGLVRNGRQWVWT